MKTQFNILCNQYRKEIIESASNTGIGHFGGTLSVVEVITYLYHNFMNLDEDVFILSKGHAAIMQYLALKNLNIINEDTKLYGMMESKLEAHPSIKIDGIKFPSGSLGQGLSGSVGYSISKKMLNREGYCITLIGDGELNEGQIWEALISISQQNLSNMILIIDFNGFQLDGPSFDILSIQKINEILKIFGWNTIICDGHSYDDIHRSFDLVKKNNSRSAVLLRTIKGKGISFMENNNDYHGSFCYSIEEESSKALDELRRCCHEQN